MTPSFFLPKINLVQAKNNHPTGQVGLLVILIMIVIGVVVLAVLSQTVTGLRLTSLEQSASQALRVAEAGVEEGLRTLNPAGLSGTLDGVSYQVDIEQEGASGFITEQSVAVGDVVEINLEGSPTYPTSLNLYWTDSDNPSESPSAAIEVIKYQLTAPDTYQTTHYAFDPDGTRRTSNNFSAPTSTTGTIFNHNFSAVANIPITTDDLLVRVKVYYNQASIAISPQPGGSVIPDQRYRIVSTGQTEGDVIRKVEVTRTNPILPPIFDAALYSGTSLIQQTR